MPALKDPNPPTSALADLGSTLRVLGRTDDARAALLSAVQANPDDIEARRQLAGLMVNQDQLTEAMALLQEVAGTEQTLRCELGRIQLAQGDETGLALLEACWRAGGTLSQLELVQISAMDP